jgi:hypothetical protein
MQYYVPNLAILGRTAWDQPLELKYTNLIDEIKSLNFPCIYGSYKSSPSIPFTTVVFAYSNDMMADNNNYAAIGNYQLEYYNKIKFPPDEKKIENKLKELRLPYIKTETYIESEDLYQIIYEFQLI